MNNFFKTVFSQKFDFKEKINKYLQFFTDRLNIDPLIVHFFIFYKKLF